VAVVVQFVAFLAGVEGQGQFISTVAAYTLFLFGGITGLAGIESFCGVFIAFTSKVGTKDWNLGSLVIVPFFEMVRHVAVSFSAVESVTIENPVLVSRRR
jgi:uncharacterized membrane protein